MRVQEGHAHADTRYKAIGFADYYMLLVDTVETKYKGYTSLTVHLPYELQHPQQYPNLLAGKLFVLYGQILTKIIPIPLYWENAPALVVGKWTLACGQTDLGLIPETINLCLDTGHIMLESKNPKQTIRLFLQKFGTRVKHIHLHENDLNSDQHLPPSHYLTKQFVKEIVAGRTWIVEKPE